MNPCNDPVVVRTFKMNKCLRQTNVLDKKRLRQTFFFKTDEYKCLRQQMFKTGKCLRQMNVLDRQIIKISKRLTHTNVYSKTSKRVRRINVLSAPARS